RRLRRHGRSRGLALDRLGRRRATARLLRRGGLTAVTKDFDAIVVGSGPGGSTVADALTAAGWSVLVLEKGRNHLIDLDDPTRLLQDYSNDEIKFLFRHFLGPDPLLEPRTFRHAD